MANKILKGINFPGLEDTYIIPQVDATLKNQGESADAQVTGNRFDTLETQVNAKITAPVDAQIGQLLSVKEVSENGEVIWETTEPGQVSTDPDFEKEGHAADAKLTGDRLKDLEMKVADILYKEIQISSFTAKFDNESIFEKGESLTGKVYFAWTLNKTPEQVLLNEKSELLSPNGSDSVDVQDLKETTGWTLQATDEKKTVSRVAKIQFLNGVYYGGLDADAEVTSTALNNLSTKLAAKENAFTTYKMTAAEGQKLTFAMPVSYGTPAAFVHNNSEYEWTLIAENFSHKNASEHIESYNVWQNDKVTPGTYSITVTKA